MKGLGTFLLAFLSLAFLVNLCSTPQSSSPRKIVKESPSPNVPSPHVELPKTSSLETCFAPIFGKRLRAQNVFPGKNGEGATVVVLFEIENAWSESSAKRDIERTMWEAYHAIYTCGYPVALVDLKAQMQLIDQYGHEELETVYRTSLSQTVAQKINWENHDIMDPAKVWKRMYLHPLFFRELFR